jgi:hypothetical protein
MLYVDKERLYKCPLCGSKLYTYSIVGINVTESCYCPECDIVREYIMSEPYLCNKCYSASFYKKDNKHYCWFCDNDEFIGVDIEEIEKFADKDGFKLSVMINNKNTYKNNKCEHKHIKNIRHNDTVFKITCKDCGRTEYVHIPKWLQEERDIEDELIL